MNGPRNDKYVVFKYRSVRDAVESNIVHFGYMPSSDNLFDSFTKVLNGEYFTEHSTWLGVCQPFES